MKPTEVFDYGRVVYEYIKQNPLVTRGGLNSQYRTSSDDRRNRNLTWVLEALLAHQYVFKHTDPETAQVYFWAHEFTRSPHQADVVPELSYKAVDVFGTRPVVQVEPKKPEPIHVEEPEEPPPAQPEEPEVDTSDATTVMERTYARLNGSLRAFYKVMMEKPCALYSKTDKQFEALVPKMPDRARFLGRMFGIGAIRRFKDPLDKNVAYYTIFGECPATMEEDTSTLSVSERKKLAEKLKETKKVAPFVFPESFPPAGDEENAGAAEVADDTQELEEEDEQQQDADTDETEFVTPTAFLANDGSVMMQRTNGSMDEFDIDESMAIVELFLMTNHEALRERLAKMKAAQ